ncbi:hypothetical protein EDB19DRAFT_1835836 [Suillus lakei]|nr:hypothetical protein EDB19DRAFT_1835836 [Suillus lakei]
MDSHDYNDEFGNGESFSKTCDWQVILLEWESCVSKKFNKKVEDDAVVKKGSKDNAYVLEIGANGLPVLPDHTNMDSDKRKAVVWAFLNWYYNDLTGMTEDCSGKPKDPVPWKELQEPSRMNQEEATELLDFWYDRQENCQDVMFEFYSWWSKADKEVKPLVGKMAEEEGGGQGKKNLGGKAKTGASTRQKSGVRVADPSDSLDSEDRHPAKKAKPAKGNKAKTTKGIQAKKTSRSKYQVASDDSGDDSYGRDSSDEFLDDERPTGRKGKESIQPKTNRLGKKGVPPELKKAKEVDSEHSAYEEPDDDNARKAIDKPNQTRPNGKKCAAEDPLDESPAKRTRSKMVDVLLKRSKRLNSKYASNFVRS